MPAKDVYHDAVKNALVRDGWTITHDPYTLSYGRRDVYVDLGAEKPIAAEKEGRKIAVEVKSFIGPSEVHDLEMAIGQYVLYRFMIAHVEPDRQLFLAVSEAAFIGVLSDDLGRQLLDDTGIQVIVVDVVREVILQWIPPTKL
jgi:hypothetical protein